jgi:hypothetical protein
MIAVVLISKECGSCRVDGRGEKKEERRNGGLALLIVRLKERTLASKLRMTLSKLSFAHDIILQELICVSEQTIADRSRLVDRRRCISSGNARPNLERIRKLDQQGVKLEARRRGEARKAYRPCCLCEYSNEKNEISSRGTRKEGKRRETHISDFVRSSSLSMA